MANTVFQVGAKVTLVKPLGPGKPGDEGLVDSVNTDGTVNVTIHYRNPSCVPFVFALPPATPDHFRPDGHCP